MRVLLVDKQYKNRITRFLRTHGINVNSVGEAEDALDVMNLHDHDVIIVCDRGDHSKSLSLIKDFRANEERHKLSTTPMITFSNYTNHERAIQLLEAGSDDFLVTDPDNFEELVSRIYALYRRSLGKAFNVVSFDNFEFDIKSKKLTSHGDELKLKPIETRVLSVIAENKGQLVTTQKIQSHIYNDDHEIPLSNVVQNCISYIRAALAPHSGGFNHLENIRGLGYMLVDKEQAQEKQSCRSYEIV